MFSICQLFGKQACAVVRDSLLDSKQQKQMRVLLQLCALMGPMLVVGELHTRHGCVSLYIYE